MENTGCPEKSLCKGSGLGSLAPAFSVPLTNDFELKLLSNQYILTKGNINSRWTLNFIMLRIWPMFVRPTKRGSSNEIQKRLGKPAISIVGVLLGPRTLTLFPKEEIVKIISGLENGKAKI